MSSCMKDAQLDSGKLRKIHCSASSDWRPNPGSSVISNCFEDRGARLFPSWRRCSTF